MKRKDLIKKLETKEKELKGLISMGDQLGEEMAIAGASDDDGTVQL